MDLYSVQKYYPEGDSSLAFLLDVSKSMNVEDIGMDKESRLESAKEYIYDILETQRWYDFSLAIFAWESQRVIPFTRNIDVFTTLLWWIDSRNIVKQWSNIESGLEDALISFWEERTGSIIVLTDGDESDIDINSKLIKDIKSQDINIIIIWFGSQEWWYIPTGNNFQPYKVYEWQRVIASLNQDWLKKMARKIWGEYKNYIHDDLSIFDEWTWTRNNENPKIFYIFCLLWIMFIRRTVREIYFKRWDV